MTQNISSPSLSGNSSSWSIGGDTVYSDVLWNNHLIGDFSSQGMPDYNHTIIPSLHNFTYDVYFYVEDPSVSQALEFDINQFVDGNPTFGDMNAASRAAMSGTSGTIPADVAPDRRRLQSFGKCLEPPHLQVQRTSDNQLLFQSITLNGVTSTLNYYEDPTPTTWYGVTINYQQDGNYAADPLLGLARQTELHLLVRSAFR
jgi:hypothetical protein